MNYNYKIENIADIVIEEITYILEERDIPVNDDGEFDQQYYVELWDSVADSVWGKLNAMVTL